MVSYSVKMYYGDQLIGTLSQGNDRGLPELVYKQIWRDQGFAIAPALTLDKQHNQASAYNYLDNLLPEGNARSLLAQNLAVSEQNIYPKILALGKDLSGAVRFTNDEQGLPDTPHFEELTEGALIKRLDHKEDIGLLHWNDKPRLSVAGVQHKLNVFINSDGKMGFAEGSLCSTHILKFERTDCPHLVLNEFFCMQLSKSVGLPTAKVLLTRFGYHPALIVKRFDRKYDPVKNKVLRRHVIDGCQALDLPRDNKYERNLGDGRDVRHIRDGVSLSSLFEFCQQMSSPAKSVQWLTGWQLFNLMISNYDSHGKNISCFFHRAAASFTPAYDLVNVSMFTQFKQVLSMAMGDEFDPLSIHAYQLADFAEQCHLSKPLLTRTLTELGEKVLAELNEDKLVISIKDSNNLSNNEVEYLCDMANNIAKRTTHLIEQAQNIRSINV